MDSLRLAKPGGVCRHAAGRLSPPCQKHVAALRCGRRVFSVSSRIQSALSRDIRSFSHLSAANASAFRVAILQGCERLFATGPTYQVLSVLALSVSERIVLRILAWWGGICKLKPPPQKRTIEVMPVDPTCQLDAGVIIHHPGLVNLYGCQIGAETRIGAFVEIQKGAVVGRRCKISSHCFICEGVSIEDEVFIGHGVMFTNDSYPRATNDDGKLQTDRDWQAITTHVRRGASIGSNATILPGVTIGEQAIVAAGAVVTHNVPDGANRCGRPATVMNSVDAHSKLPNAPCS